MPTIHPIDAITFAVAPENDVSTRIAPPYDVLDEQPKQQLLERDSRNIVAVDLPVTPPKTVGPDQAYAKAGEQFRHWLNTGVLVRQAEPALYAYEQVYTISGHTLRRRGLFAGVGLQPFNQPKGVFRHEMTIQGGIDDRYKLMAATKAQMSPVFGIFSDPDQQVVNLLQSYFDQREPDFHGTTAHDNVQHRCWRITDEKKIEALQQFFVQREVFIADGHHRYTTALQYHQDHPEDINAASCLFVLVAAEDRGMIVLPTHRVICGLQGFSMDKLRALIEQHPGLVWRDDFDDARFGLYDPLTDKTHGLDATDDVLDALYPNKPEVWRQLDVAILHELIIKHLLTPAFSSAATNTHQHATKAHPHPHAAKAHPLQRVGSDTPISFKYTAELEQMKQWTAQRDPAGDRLGVIMRATPLEAVMGVSLANEVMPPKSTFFYPKLATGMVVKVLG